MVKAVTRKHRRISITPGDDGKVSWRVAADVLQPDAIADLPMDSRIGVDEIGEPCIEDRRDTVIEGFAMQGLVTLLAEELEILPPEEIARVGECRHQLPSCRRVFHPT